MEVPMEADVWCSTGVCGKSAHLIIDPINEQVTHLVVAESAFPHVERMVPVRYIVETTHDQIKLSCTEAEYGAMESFAESDFIHSSQVELTVPFDGSYLFWPYSLYEAAPILVESSHIPAGEVAIHRGTPVYASDRRIGKVDEFLIYPTTHSISHLILREGHLWGQKDVVIPVDAISKFTADAVYLTMDKKAVEDLPAIPLSRKWK